MAEEANTGFDVEIEEKVYKNVFGNFTIDVERSAVEILGGSNNDNIPLLFCKYIPVFRVPLSPLLLDNGFIPALREEITARRIPEDSFEKINENIKNTARILAEEVSRNGANLRPSVYNERITEQNLIFLQFSLEKSTPARALVIPDVYNGLEAAIPSDIDKEKHRDRNKMQFGYAPSNIKTMENMCELGLFAKSSFNFLLLELVPEGHSGTHNLRKEDDTRFGRTLALLPGWKATYVNTDYRGVDEKFKGMQFVYNDITEQLVVDEVNKGTFDFVAPSMNINDIIGHFQKDVLTWICWGNMGADNLNDMVIPQKTEDRINFLFDEYFKRNKAKAKSEILALFPERKGQCGE